MKGVLIDCAKIERLSADIYRQLAAQSRFRKEVRETFAQLAEDELEHAAQLDLVLQLPEDSLGMVKRISGAKVSEGLERVRQVAGNLVDFAASEEAALRVAIELENSFVKIHLENAIHFSEPKIAGLFESLGRGDEAHLDTLKNCLGWWHAQKSKQQGPG